MVAYVATAHLTGTRPRRAHGDAARPRPIDPLLAFAPDAPIEEVVASRSSAARLDDRVHAIRSSWAESLFFLFDPESWR
jgi:hypothetical protein